ncbi:PREDICTED: uncharacterized protein LOC101295940 isoform X2 [Fragaria vesca subsp. vesca]|uniref:uncharacterized protein LOC101295940 isoform X2 n=1 Tax=Fragaria vesca subsp. vesca TaxID=101020 RepID=UPI0002C302C0|nr:PREDICTED: uncharacterized protein LOC101295940 isoform X2 [Fragaria vesca subsp. vesca]
MMDFDQLLELDNDDPVLNPPTAKKRKKVIGLDDLLTDFYKEEDKLVEKAARKAKAKAQRKDDSDEEDQHQEASLCQLVDTCENQIKDIGGKEDSFVWGICVFRDQKSPPPLAFPELESCALLQSFMNNKLNSEFQICLDNGNTLLEGLLVNGWLSNVVFAKGHVEKSVAMWTFNLMAYSSIEELRTSACDFWCAILSSKNEPVTIDWFASYSELKVALENYGFLFNFSNMENVYSNSVRQGPAQNIRAWIKYVTTACQVRSKKAIYLTSEAEELMEVIIYLFLDRQLQGLFVLLHECMQSAISYFTEDEWQSSCEKIAKSLACRIPKDVNCLRIVECISGAKTRSKLFRSVVAYQILHSCFDYKARDEVEILNLLISVNVKEKNCDFFKLYVYLVLTENWLLSNQENRVLIEMWRLYLRNCSCLIASTDLRSFASKARNKASYLLQGTITQ